MHNFLVSNRGFLHAGDDYAAADWVLFGLPMDWTTSFRPGTRHAPARIREVSLMGMEGYSPAAGASLAERSFYDAGDVDMAIGDVTISLERIGEVTRGILADGKRPLALGGEHLVSLPLIKAAAEKYPDLVVLHFDAHSDLRESFFGNDFSHATVLRQAYQYLKPGNLHQFGIRSGSREEIIWAAENIQQHRDVVLEPLLHTIPLIQDLPVYITLDIDVMDPAYAPGTGTPEAGGVSSKEILAAIKAMGALRVVGMDLVEVSPLSDPSDRTSVLAAKLVREAILEFMRK